MTNENTEKKSDILFKEYMKLSKMVIDLATKKKDDEGEEEYLKRSLLERALVVSEAAFSNCFRSECLESSQSHTDLFNGNVRVINFRFLELEKRAGMPIVNSNTLQQAAKEF